MSKKSFTLVELMVVVAIISILAAGLLVGLGGARKKARDSRRISDLRNVQAALEVYYSIKKQYPDSSTITTWDDLENELSSAGVTSQLPRDPLPGQSYEYASCDSNQRYVLRAQLENSSDCPTNYKAPDTTTCNPSFDCDCSTNGYYCITFR